MTGAISSAVAIGGDEQGRQVLLAQAGADLLTEPLLERDREQEGEQDLHPGLGDPQFLEQLVVVPVGAFEGRLVAHVLVIFGGATRRCYPGFASR